MLSINVIKNGRIDIFLANHMFHLSEKVPGKKLQVRLTFEDPQIDPRQCGK